MPTKSVAAQTLSWTVVSTFELSTAPNRRRVPPTLSVVATFFPFFEFLSPGRHCHWLFGFLFPGKEATRVLISKSFSRWRFLGGSSNGRWTSLLFITAWNLNSDRSNVRFTQLLKERGNLFSSQIVPRKVNRDRWTGCARSFAHDARIILLPWILPQWLYVGKLVLVYNRKKARTFEFPATRSSATRFQRPDGL